MSSELLLTTVLPTSWVPKDSLTCFSWNSFFFSILAFLIERISSCIVSNVPEAVYVSSAIVDATSASFVGSSVTLNNLVPVSNLGC